MRKQTRMVMAAMLWYGAMASTGMGGTGYDVACENKTCGYHASQVMFGGGMFHEALTGYCVKCRQFVYLSWKRDGKAPEPLARVWDGATGKTLLLYGCPRCKDAFLPIADEKGLQHCPKCSQPTLHRKAVLAID